MTPIDLWILRGLYLFALLGAGTVGVLALTKPGLAAIYALPGARTRGPELRLIGSVWTGAGLAALLGLWRPEMMVGLLFFQLFYKSVWLIAAMLSPRDETSAPGMLRGLFAFWVLSLSAGLGSLYVM